MKVNNLVVVISEGLDSPVLQILAVLYNGFSAANQEPRLLGTVENKVRLFQVLACYSTSNTGTGSVGY